MEQKCSKSIEYWADYVTSPSDYTCDLDLEFSGSNLKIALSQEWEGRLQQNKRDVY